MRSSVLVRGGRVAAGAVLVTAGVIGAPLLAAWPSVSDASELAKLVLFLLLFGLGPAIAAVLATLARDYEAARRRVFALAAVAGALPPIVSGFASPSSSAYFWVILSVPWALVLAIPTLPVIRAVVEARESPSFDAFDRVVAMSCGFLAAVKGPEAIGALTLGEEKAAAIIGTVAAFGVIGCAIFQVRRLRRAERARALLHTDGLAQQPEIEISEEAALFSGTPRLRIVRSAAAADYRRDERTELVAIVPEEPIAPSVRSDLWRLSQSAFIAMFLALLAVGLGFIGRSF